MNSNVLSMFDTSVSIHRRCWRPRDLTGKQLSVVDENRAEVVHIRQRRSGDQRVAERREEAVTIVVVQHVLGPQAQGPCTGERVGSDTGARDLFLAVDTISVSSERMDARVTPE